MLLLPAALSAQWKFLAGFPTTVSLVKVYPNNVIFVGLGRSPGSVNSAVGISKSTDAGKTWVTASIPGGYIGEVSDILMTDAMNGFATLATRFTTQPGLWKTSDGGLTWSQATLNGSFTCIYQTSAAIIITDLLTTGWFSTDQGQTWTPLPFNGCNGIDFTDDLHGVVSLYRGPTWEITSDGGLTWAPCLANTIESWSVYAVKNTDTVYAAPEGPTNGNPYVERIIKSTDRGNTWAVGAAQPYKSTGDMRGIPTGQLYWQTCYNGNNNTTNGLYLSEDGGILWKNIGGPSGWNDSRFAVRDNGCGNAIIYAPDQSGGLYQYNDTRNTLLPANPNYHTTGWAPITACQLDSELITITNPYCTDLVLYNLGLDSAEYFSYLSHALPDTLASGMTDSIWVVFNPRFAPGVHNAHLRLLGYQDNLAGHYVLDTTFNLSGTASATAPSVVSSPNAMNLGRISTCNSADSSMLITNTGCDTLTLDSLAGVAAGLEWSGITFPVRLAPDSSVSLIFSFHPLASGTVNGTYMLYARQEGISASQSLQVQATAVYGEGLLNVANPSASFVPISICSRDSATIVYRNFGCDTLVVTESLLTGDTDFYASGNTAQMLTPGDSTVIEVYFTPAVKGTRSGAYVIKSHSIKDTSNEQDTTIAFSTMVGDGTRVLSIDTATRDFHLGNLCRIADTAIILTNFGCDTLTLKNVLLSGAGYSLLNKPNSILPPGASDTLDVEFTASVVGSAAAILTVSTNADTDSTALIPVTAQTIPPPSVKLLTAMSRSATLEKDSTTLFVYPDHDVANLGINAIAFMLNYNGDLLTETSMATAIPNATLAPAMVQQTGSAATLAISISGNNLSLDSSQPIVAVHFKTALTAMDSTPLSVTNLTLNGGDPIYASCTLAATDTETSFALDLRCGDPTIQDLLRGNLGFALQSITPNPTSGLLDIAISYPQPGVGYQVSGVGYQVSGVGGIEYELDDALGRTAREGSITGTATRLDLGQLPSGSYYLRLSQNGFVETRRVVVER